VIDHRFAARLYGGARVAIGLGLLLAPALATRRWIGPVAEDPALRSPLRMLGVRDALLGLAVLATPDAGPARRGALALSVFADGADAVVLTQELLRTRRLAPALAAAAAVGGVAVGVWTATSTEVGIPATR
jgi:hypothetical protein